MRWRSCLGWARGPLVSYVLSLTVNILSYLIVAYKSVGPTRAASAMCFEMCTVAITGYVCQC